MVDNRLVLNARLWPEDPIHSHKIGVEINSLRTTPDKLKSALVLKRSFKNSNYSLGVAGCEALLHKAESIGIHSCYIAIVSENGAVTEYDYNAIDVLGQITSQELVGGKPRGPKKGGFFSDYWWISQEGVLQRRNRGNFPTRDPERAERLIEKINQIIAGEAA